MGDGAPAGGGAVHQPGVEVGAAVAVEDAAAPRIERAVGFHRRYGRYGGVERGSAPFQHRAARRDGPREPVEVGRALGVGDGPGAAVDEQRRAARREAAAHDPARAARAPVRVVGHRQAQKACSKCSTSGSPRPKSTATTSNRHIAPSRRRSWR